MAFASFLGENPGAFGTVSLAVRTAEEAMRGKFDKFNVMRRSLQLVRLCEIAASERAARVAREEREDTVGSAASDATGDAVMREEPETTREEPETTRVEMTDHLFDQENVLPNMLATPVTAEAARKRGASAE